MNVSSGPWWQEAAGYAAAVLGPAVLTAILQPVGAAQQRDYVFLYIALVAVIAVLRGLLPALLAAAVSFLLVDYFFVAPIHTLTIADEPDLVNLAVFFGTAGVVGSLASNRRRAYLQAQQLARQAQQLNAELTRLNREQAEAAQAAIRLARTEQQVATLQQLDRDRRDLLANVSHDLRTPIGSILTDSTNMLRTQQMNASVRYRLESIAAEARRLNQLVSDMLDMARIEGGALQLTLEPVQVKDAITAAAERLKHNSPERLVQWTDEDARVSVLADWNRLGQIFDNLLANADRAAPRGTPIQVTVSQEGGGFVTIRVIDAGPGVPADLRDRLFTRFVKKKDEASDGTGLGLAITKGLVEAHAGTITLEDRSEGGASFRFTLPKADS
ncbi:MAG TPA: ATP-binding protein [Candidatus Limnocylindrales bacterium]|nr:ATP-binding protein [Candidatus Limnocylindrales bacterium]